MTAESVEASCRERDVIPTARRGILALGQGLATAGELPDRVLRGPKRAAAGLPLGHEGEGDRLSAASRMAGRFLTPLF